MLEALEEIQNIKTTVYETDEAGDEKTDKDGNKVVKEYKQPYANGVTTGEIMALASENEEWRTGRTKYTHPNLRTAVTAFPAKGREAPSQVLGSVIAGLKNKTIGGYRLVKNGERNHSAIWLVTRPPQ